MVLNGQPGYGFNKTIKHTRRLHTHDNPLPEQLEQSNTRCIGINNIDNKALIYYMRNLCYRPQNMAYIVHTSANVDYHSPYIFH